jgi:hypothetical protein
MAHDKIKQNQIDTKRFELRELRSGGILRWMFSTRVIACVGEL